MLPIIANYSIKDLERLSGVKAHTIRIWEQRYSILKPERTDSNIRLYRDHELRMLLNISLLIRHGSKISHVSRLSSQEICLKVQQLVKSPASSNEYFDAQIDNLVFAMLDIDASATNAIFDSAISRFGVEQTIMALIIPFLSRVGMMWSTGEASVFQEHFLTNLIRERVIVEISNCKNQEVDSGDCYVLFLPEAELHEMGLLFASYLLKKRGKRVIYLGQNMPLFEIIQFSNLYKPTYLLTFFTAGYSFGSIKEYITEISGKVLHSTILIAGSSHQQGALPLVDNVCFLKHVEDLISIAERPVDLKNSGN